MAAKPQPVTSACHAPAARARAPRAQPPRRRDVLVAAGPCAEFQGLRATLQGGRVRRRPSHSRAASAAAAARTRRSWAQTRRMACPRAAGERAGEQQASLSVRSVRRAHAKTEARGPPPGTHARHAVSRQPAPAVLLYTSAPAASVTAALVARCAKCTPAAATARAPPQNLYPCTPATATPGQHQARGNKAPYTLGCVRAAQRARQSS